MRIENFVVFCIDRMIFYFLNRIVGGSNILREMCICDFYRWMGLWVVSY